MGLYNFRRRSVRYSYRHNSARVSSLTLPVPSPDKRGGLRHSCCMHNIGWRNCYDAPTLQKYSQDFWLASAHRSVSFFPFNAEASILHQEGKLKDGQLDTTSWTLAKAVEMVDKNTILELKLLSLGEPVYACVGRVNMTEPGRFPEELVFNIC
ncbi:hypothetical protein HAX54_050051 [Datura stramonium]|uniref:Uncharacterized protein n=1 Tax=Datura stramonium TaxID=4076 RepID=A0ABS8SWL9_DATST|nr:hypothetical protein [Datura stramonium]